MSPLRCLIDTMIFDAIAAEPGAVAVVDRLTSARRLELLATPTSIAQVAATPDAGHRRVLQGIRVLVVPPADGDPAARDVLAGLRRAGVDHDDALIAAAAALENVPLATEDRALRLAVAELLPQLPLWRWSTGLLPAIAELASERPEPPRRRRR